MSYDEARDQPGTKLAMVQQIKGFSTKSGAPPTGAARVVTTAVAWFFVSDAAFAAAAVVAAAIHLRIFAAVLTTCQRRGHNQSRSSTSIAKSKK